MEFPLAFSLWLRYDMGVSTQEKRVLTRQVLYTTAARIFPRRLSTANKEKPVISEVVAVGPGDKETEMVVKAGDKVVVGKYTGTEIKLDGKDYTIVKQSDILAIVE